MAMTKNGMLEAMALLSDAVKDEADLLEVTGLNTPTGEWVIEIKHPGIGDGPTRVIVTSHSEMYLLVRLFAEEKVNA